MTLEMPASKMQASTSAGKSSDASALYLPDEQVVRTLNGALEELAQFPFHLATAKSGASASQRSLQSKEQQSRLDKLMQHIKSLAQSLIPYWHHLLGDPNDEDATKKKGTLSTSSTPFVTSSNRL